MSMYNRTLFIFATVASLKSSQSFSLQQEKYSVQIKLEALEQRSMISRRSILFDSIALATTAGSIASSNNKDSTSFLQPSCLDLHLPPKPTNAVRLYLCRHGQTENNRLHKLQGGNVNPPLNENGFLMAARLGKTLQKNIMNADGPTHRHHSPTLIYHSTMLRAQQTAESAAAQFSHKIDKKSQMPLRTIGLDSLVELDYSLSSWGKKDTIMPSREEVQRIYDRWAAGYIDEPLGKESARDILNRCAQALTTMVEGARAEKSRSVVAVAHGSYLRFLLACALDLPLAKYATNIRLDNGSISVLDVELETEPILRTLNNSNFFIESRSRRRKSNNFSMSIPKSTAVRVNEIRHLSGIPRS